MRVTIWQARVGDGWRYADPELAAFCSHVRPGSVRLTSVSADVRPRFRREHRPAPRTVTPRRLACARRALDRQADAVPLFAHLVRAEQPTPEERIARIDEWGREFEQNLRDCDARHWPRGPGNPPLTTQGRAGTGRSRLERPRLPRHRHVLRQFRQGQNKGEVMRPQCALGRWDGMKAGRHKVVSDDTLDQLDAYFKANPDDPDASTFHRDLVTAGNPARVGTRDTYVAWVKRPGEHSIAHSKSTNSHGQLVHRVIVDGMPVTADRPDEKVIAQYAREMFHSARGAANLTLWDGDKARTTFLDRKL